MNLVNAAKNWIAKNILHITPERSAQAMSNQSNPTKNLTPDKLNELLMQFKRGYLREFYKLAEEIMDRDITVATVAPKRISSVSSLDWEVFTLEDSPEADAHAEALRYLFNHLSVRHAVKGDQRGDIKLLIEQMMSAVPYEYAAHEIAWKPQASGELAAEFRFVPLNYFEATTGRLRFLPTEYSLTGTDLEEDGWMVTIGPGLMRSCSIAWLFKNRSLANWLIYSGRFGMPGLKGISNGEEGSPEWESMKEALRSFYNEWAAVISPGQNIELVEVAGGASSLPFPPLHEAMRNAILALWRGGDLSTQSSGPQATGTNAQQGEAQLLQLGDVQMVNNAIHEYVTRVAIRYLFGEGVEPQAYFRLKVPKAEVTASTIAADQFLLNSGVALGRRDLLERYGRPEPEEADDLVLPPSPPPNYGDTPPNGSLPRKPTGADPAGSDNTSDGQPLANAAPETASTAPQLTALADDLQPIRKRLADILSLADPAQRSAQLAAFRDDLPKLLAVINAAPDLAAAIQARLEAAFRAGYAGQTPPNLGAAPAK